ncbi:hypothetical protein CORC01_08571 [Colletotrichum orchidophilum]|uniref:Uncharacterized protein n=1 Tax=Colletotrichum orchidophilum TaxID=1209926 RepID=A0A1G4B471_9PEZI|nr:uncharacterized protein CORC01_08571 [Colletotrichum orchidophilum]OHE96194.1 hypothetical protein CORC01_08571 [Colletotrichum orchidophilum]
MLSSPYIISSLSQSSSPVQLPGCLHATCQNRNSAWMTKEEFGVEPPLTDSFAEGSPVTLQHADCSKDSCDFSAPESQCEGEGSQVLQTPAARPSFALPIFDIAAAPPLRGLHPVSKLRRN